MTTITNKRSGELQKNGHFAQSFILKWLEEPHIVLVDGRGKAIGGGKVAAAVVDKALKHMQAWVPLVNSIVTAEFPAFHIIAAFGAFALSPAPTPLTREAETKLKRLASTFKQPGCPA